MDPNRLRAVPLFATMDDAELRRISTFATEDSASEGRALVREGEYSTELIALEEGTADVLRNGERVATLGPGDVFGEIGVLDNEMRTATVVATSAVRMLKLTTWEIKRLSPETRARLRGVMEERRGRDHAHEGDAPAEAHPA